VWNDCFARRGFWPILGDRIQYYEQLANFGVHPQIVVEHHKNI
jgi:hypothetical protein